MSGEWKSHSLGELASNISRRFDFSGKDRVVFINTGDVLEGFFLHNDYSSVEGLPGQAKKAIAEGDILYSEIRPGNKRYVLVDGDMENIEDYVVSTKFMVVKASNKVLPEFLYLVLTSRQCEEEFKIIAESRSGTFPQITFDAVSYYPIQTPSLATQRAIWKVHQSLANKIVLNRQINATLEQLAQTVFKSWFVDFDPVRAKQDALEAGSTPEDANRAAMRVISGKTDSELSELQTQNPAAYDQLASTAALFPAAMQDSELGEIPEGWEIMPLGELLTLQRGFDLPVKKRKGGDVPIFASTGIVGYHNEVKVKAPGVVTGRSGSLGTVMYAAEDFWPLNTTLWVKEFKHVGVHFTAHLLSGMDLARYNAGAAVPTLNRNHVHQLEVICPSLDVLRSFETCVDTFFAQIKKHEKTTATLATLRDTLLPKLLSGELQLPEDEP